MGWEYDAVHRQLSHMGVREVHIIQVMSVLPGFIDGEALEHRLAHRLQTIESVMRGTDYRYYASVGVVGPDHQIDPPNPWEQTSKRQWERSVQE